MFNEFDNGYWNTGFNPNPAVKFHVGYGYDPDSYISTAKLIPCAYTTQALIIGKLGGLTRLIEACDDSAPPVGSLDPNNPTNNPAYTVYNSVIQTVTTEVNGYLSSVYPIPLAQTGTVSVIQITDVNSTGGVTGLKVIQAGNYLDAPNVDQFPSYLQHLDPLANCFFWGDNWLQLQLGTGLELTVAYATVNYSDESGQVLQAKTVTGTPLIVATGTGYCANQFLVLIGGSSFVPAKIRQATLDLICHTFYKRRFAPDEKNPFSGLAQMWRKCLTDIGNEDEPLDGTYKRFYSAGSSWNQRSILFGANSL